ncbi:hypothetical protein JCM10207_005187 [Rhodosporidiobolus poonsookiae]
MHTLPAPPPAFPPPLQPSAHARLAYVREDSLSPARTLGGLPPSSSRGRGRARAYSIGASASRERSVSTAGRSEWTEDGSEWGADGRGRSVSSEGRAGSRAPLWRKGYLLAFLGTLISILVVCAISYGLAEIDSGFDSTPLAFGSLGATAVLLYATPEGPLSQPKNVVGGHMISALIGCIFSQLFSLSSVFSAGAGVEDNQLASADSWARLTPVCAALSVAFSVLAMQVTGTVHPPGGATALIAAFHRTAAPRWTFLLVVFLSVTSMTLWALVVGNLGRRRYPVYWWNPPHPPSPSPTPPSPPISVTDKPTGTSAFVEHTPSPLSFPQPHAHQHPSPRPHFTPEQDLQQRWLGRLGEVDEEALAGFDLASEDGAEGEGEAEMEGERRRQMREAAREVGVPLEGGEEEERRGRTTTRE